MCAFCTKRRGGLVPIQQQARTCVRVACSRASILIGLPCVILGAGSLGCLLVCAEICLACVLPKIAPVYRSMCSCRNTLLGGTGRGQVLAPRPQQRSTKYKKHLTENDAVENRLVTSIQPPSAANKAIPLSRQPTQIRKYKISTNHSSRLPTCPRPSVLIPPPSKSKPQRARVRQIHTIKH